MMPHLYGPIVAAGCHEFPVARIGTGGGRGPSALSIFGLNQCMVFFGRRVRVPKTHSPKEAYIQM